MRVLPNLADVCALVRPSNGGHVYCRVGKYYTAFLLHGLAGPMSTE